MDGRRRSTSPETVGFAAKIDTWILILIAGSAAVCLYAAGSAILAAVPGRWLIATVLVASAASSMWILFSTSYALDATELRARSGPFRWAVPLVEIRAVKSTRNPLSSPAPSLDRLRIDYGAGRSIMISPRDKEAFLRELGIRRSGTGHS